LGYAKKQFKKKRAKIVKGKRTDSREEEEASCGGGVNAVSTCPPSNCGHVCCS